MTNSVAIATVAAPQFQYFDISRYKRLNFLLSFVSFHPNILSINLVRQRFVNRSNRLLDCFGPIGPFCAEIDLIRRLPFIPTVCSYRMYAPKTGFGALIYILYYKYHKIKKSTMFSKF